ncbi:tectonic-1 isoform X2 [Hyla sarda]|uniref:tectonic-1 isoform X2 n=1 Tax=Hyla sarda TaxID=327740 RepID=UPI0024C37E12|nr:tectonic-1 isoform X2 [Hyla sarda]
MLVRHFLEPGQTLVVYSNAAPAAMPVCQRCILALLAAAVCGAAASGTAGPDTRDYFSVDNVTEYGDLLGNDTGEGASTSAPGEYTGSPPSGAYLPADTHSDSPGEDVTTSRPPVTVELPVSTELPQPRSIPALITPVGSLCVCDLLVNACDVNCCCDPDCSAADFSVFSGCSIPVVTDDSQLCKREAVLYSVSTSTVPERVTETVEINNPNIFCIQSTNYQPAMSFITPDDPTKANFDSLLKEFGGIDFNNEDVQSTVGSSEARNASKYEINVTLQAIIIKSIDEAVFRGNLSDYIPSYDNTTGVCNDVVLGGSYTFTYTDKGGITSIAASFILGAIDTNTFQQNFQIHFIENGTAPTLLSGNPGYVFGLPIVAGFKLPQSGIIQSTNRFGQLTLLKSSSDQDCLVQEGNRTPVLFGYNSISGCKLRLSYIGPEFCKFAKTAILSVLQGQQSPNYVAQFGNSQPENVLDWVPVTINTADQADVQGMCKIPVSLILKISWTKFGSLVNPQAQIVNVEENIIYAQFPNNLEDVGFIQISSSVTFVDVSQPASPGYKAQPTIDAKLPFDFFYPFL